MSIKLHIEILSPSFDIGLQTKYSFQKNIKSLPNILFSDTVFVIKLDFRKLLFEKKKKGLEGTDGFFGELSRVTSI